MSDARRPRKKKAAPDAAEELRCRAEEHLSGVDAAATAAPEDLAAAVHELRVNQIELEMQNEELRRAQFELDQQRAKYFELFDLAPVGYLTVGEEGLVGDANFTAARLLGVERQQIVGQPFSAFIFASDRDVYFRHLGLLKQTGEPQSCELRLHPAGAEPFWAHLEGQPQRATHDEPLRYHQTFTDVHERVTAEEELRETRDYLDNLFGYANAPIIVWDPELRITRFNRAFEELTGRAAEEVVGRHLELLFPENARRAQTLELVTQATAGERRQVVEIPILHVGGEVRTVLWSSATLYADDGVTPVATIAQGQDISERKQAEEALRESEEQFRTMFAGSWDAMMTLAAPSWGFTSGNPAAVEMFGARDMAEFTALGPWDVSPERQPDGSPSATKALEAIQAALREGSHFFEWTHKRLGGTEFPCNVLLTKIEMAGQVFLQATVRDIAAQKRAEEALREREEIFRSIVQQAADAIGLVEVATGRFVEFNDAACRNLGYSREEFAALTLGDIDVTWPGDGIIAALADLQAKGEDVFETRHRRKDGAIREVRVTASTVEVAGRTCVATIWSDITDSKQASEELARHRQRLEQLVAERTDELSEANRVLAERAAEVARSQQNFDTFFNTIDDLLFVLDAGGSMIHVNETVCRRLGYSEAELLGRPVLDVHPPARRDEARRIVAAMLAGEADFCPVPVVTRGGAEIPVETRVVPGLWDGGPAVFGVTKDVSALHVSEEKFQRLFRGNPTPMAVSSVPEARFTDVNEAFLRAHGYSREEVIGRTIAELGLFVEPEQYLVIAERLLGKGRDSNRELKVRCKDGTILNGLFSFEMVVSQGQPYVLSVMIDQTDRKRAVEALQESEALYRSILNTVPDNISVTDLEGRIRMVSPAGLRMFGFGREEDTVDRVLTEFLAPEDRERAEAHVELVLKGPNPGPGEYRGLRADGSTFAIGVNAALIRDALDQPTGMVFIARDITELKQAEQGLLESLATQQAITEGVIAALARTVEIRDPYTAGHQRRVSELAAATALQMGLGEQRAEGLRVGGLLHDVGKINVPAEILARPGLLSTMEYELIKGHAQAGREILAAIDFPWPVAEMALQHHERQDGSGYPAGLRSDEILLEARVLAVADVVEAMASHRPYRAALGLEAALAEVRAGAGTRYDAGVVAACEQVLSEGFVFSEA